MTVLSFNTLCTNLHVDIEPETPKNFCQTESDGVDVATSTTYRLA